MDECWVGGNRRAFAWSALTPALLAATIGAALLAAAIFAGLGPAPRIALFSLATLLLAAAVFVAGSAWFLINTPRIACRQGQVLVYLRPQSPEVLPLESVECFFLGRDSVRIGSRPSRVSNIVVRIAERNGELRARTVQTRFGGYRDGYLIVDGAWCEPITPELMKRINARLGEARRELDADRQSEEKAVV